MPATRRKTNYPRRRQDTHYDLMDCFGQLELAQTLCSLADLFGMVGRGPTTSLLLPEYYLIMAFALLTATGFLPPITNHHNTVHKEKQSFIWILRHGRNLAAQILPGKSDLEHPIDITHTMGPGDPLHHTCSTSGWKRGSIAMVLRGIILIRL